MIFGISKTEHEKEDLNLPYTIDLSNFDELTKFELRSHIQRVGLSFYQV